MPRRSMGAVDQLVTPARSKNFSSNVNCCNKSSTRASTSGAETSVSSIIIVSFVPCCLQYPLVMLRLLPIINNIQRCFGDSNHVRRAAVLPGFAVHLLHIDVDHFSSIFSERGCSTCIKKSQLSSH